MLFMINVLNMLQYICIKICNRNTMYYLYFYYHYIQLKNVQANTKHFFNKKRNKKKKITFFRSKFYFRENQF